MPKPRRCAPASASSPAPAWRGGHFLRIAGAVRGRNPQPAPPPPPPYTSQYPVGLISPKDRQDLPGLVAATKPANF